MAYVSKTRSSKRVADGPMSTAWLANSDTPYIISVPSERTKGGRLIVHSLHLTRDEFTTLMQRYAHHFGKRIVDAEPPVFTVGQIIAVNTDNYQYEVLAINEDGTIDVCVENSPSYRYANQDPAAFHAIDEQ